jgi:hypothetical protein
MPILLDQISNTTKIENPKNLVQGILVSEK